MVARFLITLILCTPLLAGADIYRCRAASGTLTFTDQPCPGGERVEVQDQRIGTRISTEDMVSIGQALAQERQTSELNRDLRTREAKVADLRRSMREDLAAPQRPTHLPPPIHDGVVWEQILSRQQQMTVQKYETLIRSEQTQIGHMADRLRHLK